MESRLKHRIVLGSLLFGMFFGAGNLIFPISIGQNAASKSPLSMLGFVVSAVGLACLAVFFTAKTKENTLEESLSPYGKTYARIFTIALLLTIGPFFALPRTATVPFEVSIRLIMPGVDPRVGLFIYSLIFFIFAMVLALKPTKLKDLIGKVINPIFLIMLLFAFIVFFMKPMGSIEGFNAVDAYSQNAFLKGFEDGYQTMDVLAAMMFGYLIIRANDKEGSEKEQFKDVIIAAIIASVLMVSIYVVLGLMGASSLNILEVSSNGGLALGQIFVYYFGKTGLIFFGLLISFACLKTAIGLIVSCSTYFSNIIPKIKYEAMVVIVTLLAFSVSNFGLETIITYAVPVLNFIYPLALMHVFVGLFLKDWEDKKTILNTLLIFTLFASVLEFLKTIPSLKETGFFVFYTKQMPLASVGLSWVNITLMGLLIGYLISKSKSALTASH